MRRRRAAVLLTVLLLGIASTACGDEGDQAQSSPSTTSAQPAPSAAATPTATATPATCPGRARSEIVLRVRHTAFPVGCLVVPAGEPLRIELVNEDAMNHNLSIETIESEDVFTGDLAFPGDTLVYRIEPLEAGSYTFRCAIHPRDMSGPLVVE